MQIIYLLFLLQVFEVDSFNDSEIELGKPTLMLESSAQQLNASMDSMSDSFSEPPYKKYKNGSAETPDDPLQCQLPGSMSQQMKKEQETPSYFYGRYVGQCLDKLDADLNLEARQKINQILFQCERAQLERQ